MHYVSLHLWSWFGSKHWNIDSSNNYLLSWLQPRIIGHRMERLPSIWSYLDLPLLRSLTPCDNPTDTLLLPFNSLVFAFRYLRTEVIMQGSWRSGWFAWYSCLGAQARQKAGNCPCSLSLWEREGCIERSNWSVSEKDDFPHNLSDITADQLVELY